MRAWLFLLLLLLPFRSFGDEASPVLYGVSPFYLVEGFPVKAFDAIRKRLPEIRELGATVIWIQPIFPSAEPGQGYDTIDHFGINPKFGTKEEFRQLVKEAHKLGLKVVLDIALNHVSEEHPFVKDVAANGKKSPYYSFFHRATSDGTPYSRHLKKKRIGKSEFTYYFWDKLLNLDFSNPRVKEYVKKVLTHWVEEFDVDGFRFDASWAISARWPDFYRKTSKHLSLRKPDLFLLAEDKAGYPAEYEESGHPHFPEEGIDAAYDWNNEDTNWISRWSFAREEENETVFNETNPRQAVREFVKGIFYTKQAEVAPLRYLENNDTASFNMHHSEAETRFAAKVMMTLPGVPLVFYGQEVSHKHEKWFLPAFDPSETLRSLAPESWEFYRDLLAFREDNPALSSGKIEKIRVQPGGSMRFVRRQGERKATVVVNFGEKIVLVDGEPLRP